MTSSTAMPTPTVWTKGRLTAYRFDDSANALAPLAGDEEDRVVIETDVELPKSKYGEADPWVSAVDAITGLWIRVRRTDCGGGCRCAVEVRVPFPPKKEN